MTMAPNAPAHSGVSARVGEQIGLSLAALRRAYETHALYRATLAELRRLDIRGLEDVGLAGQDLKAVARAAVATA